jgi:putative addiction module component (TIGR02574 family)
MQMFPADLQIGFRGPESDHSGSISWSSTRGGCSVRVMSSVMKKLGIDRLSADERLLLLEEIWDSLSDEDTLKLTNAQRAELEKRIAEDDASADELTPWEDVKRMYPPFAGK